MFNVEADASGALDTRRGNETAPQPLGGCRRPEPNADVFLPAWCRKSSRVRELSIGTENAESEGVRAAVRDARDLHLRLGASSRRMGSSRPSRMRCPTECRSGELPRCILTTRGHSGDPPRTRIPLRPTHPFSSSAFADAEVVIEPLIQFSLLGIEFRFASLFGLVCGGPRQELRCPRLHLYYRRIVQYGSSRIDQRIGKNRAPTPNQRSAYTCSDGRAHAIVPFFTGLRPD
jgi:hypothetical protein